MKVELSTGTADIKVWFSEESTGRATNVVLTPNYIGDTNAAKHITAKAVCFHKDKFSRKSGRRYAAVKLLEKIRFMSGFLKKADRAAIFNAICPEFKSAKVKRYIKNLDI